MTDVITATDPIVIPAVPEKTFDAWYILSQSSSAGLKKENGLNVVNKVRVDCVMVPMNSVTKELDISKRVTFSVDDIFKFITENITSEDPEKVTIAQTIAGSLGAVITGFDALGKFLGKI